MNKKHMVKLISSVMIISVLLLGFMRATSKLIFFTFLVFAPLVAFFIDIDQINSIYNLYIPIFYVVYISIILCLFLII